MHTAITHWHFALYWPPRIAALASALEARGDSLTVIEVAGGDSNYSFADTNKTLVSGSVRWVRLFHQKDAAGLRPARVCRALWQAFEETAPDVLMASSIAFPTGVTAVRWARARRRGVVIFDNVRLEDVPRPWWVNWVKRRIYRNVDAVLTAAPSHAATYMAWGVPEDRLFYGLNVVDNAWFSERAAAVRNKADDVRRERDLPEHYFLGVGRQIAKKNWGTLIRAYRAYRAQANGAPWHLVLVGAGPERAALEAEAADMAGVQFRPFCKPEELCHYYGTAEALVLPSFFGETWGLVVNEAMACSLPVLVSDQCGCAASLVREGKNGWTFSPSNPEHLAEAMLRLTSLSPEQRTAMGATSRAILGEWPLERFAEGALAAIEMCGGFSRPSASLFDRALLTAWRGRFRPV